MASVVWNAELAAVYDDVYAWEAEPSVVEPITGVLAGLAGSGAVRKVETLEDVAALDVLREGRVARGNLTPGLSQNGA